MKKTNNAILFAFTVLSISLNAQLNLNLSNPANKLKKANEKAFKCLGPNVYYSKALTTKESFKLYDWATEEKLDVIYIDTTSAYNKVSCKVNVISTYPVNGCSVQEYKEIFKPISSSRVFKSSSNLFIDCDVTKGILTTEFKDGQIILAYLPYINDGYRPSGIVDDIDLMFNNEKNINYDKMKIDVLVKSPEALSTVQLPGSEYKSKLMEELKKTAQAELIKKQGSLSAVKLPEAKMKNAQLETEILRAFTQSNELKNKTAKKAIITSSDWRIVNHEITGVILGRRIDATVLYTQNGRCYMCSYVFEQKYEGGGNYQKNVFYTGFSGRAEEMSCEKTIK